MSVTTQRDTAEALLGHLTGARWFAGKGRRAQVGGVTPLPWVTEVGTWPAIRFEVVEVRYLADQDPDAADRDPEEATEATPELYQLALSYRPAPDPGLAHAEIGRFVDPDLGAVVVYDAMQDPTACRLILDRLEHPRRYRRNDAEVSFHLLPNDALAADNPSGALEPRIFTGQQSNTSVMYGEVAMLKLFRRLEIGRNLDIEVHESLSRSGVADVARLYGWVEASWPGSGAQETLTADLGMLVEKLADAEDGWGLALEELRHGRDFARLAAELGHALAEIHRALRGAFPRAQVSGAQTAQVMKARLSVAAGIAPALRPHLEGLARCFDALAQTSLDTQRVHGDFHLGQTLHTPTGWKIIDFEGEPVKSLAERAEPDSVWRDIAGMLRSFDYAAATVPGPDSREWAERCRTAFLEGYTGGAISAADDAVLSAYVADKAVYEVVYEVRNRPDWVNIPLAAVAAIATDPALAGSSTALASAAQVKE